MIPSRLNLNLNLNGVLILMERVNSNLFVINFLNNVLLAIAKFLLYNYKISFFSTIIV